METNRLLQFLTVANTGSLRRSAELLGITHSALSKSLKVLQAQLGTELFYPVGRGIELTKAGKRLAIQVPKALETIDSLREKKEASGPLLRLATFEVFSTYFIDPLIQALNQAYSRDVALQCREAPPGELERCIVEENADLGLTYLPVPRSGIRFEKIAEVPMGVFVRQKAFPNHTLDQLPFAVPIQPVHATPTGVKGLDGWPDHLISRCIGFEVELMESAITLCRAGVAAAHLPRFVARLHNEFAAPAYRLQTRALPSHYPKVKREVFVVARSSEPESKLEKVIAKTIRQVVRPQEG